MFYESSKKKNNNKNVLYKNDNELQILFEYVLNID